MIAISKRAQAFGAHRIETSHRPDKHPEVHGLEKINICLNCKRKKCRGSKNCKYQKGE